VKYIGYLVGQTAEREQVEVMYIGPVKGICFFKTCQCNPADTATGAVFEYYLGALMGQLNYFVQLLAGLEIIPVHKRGGISL